MSAAGHVSLPTHDAALPDVPSEILSKRCVVFIMHPAHAMQMRDYFVRNEEHSRRWNWPLASQACRSEHWEQLATAIWERRAQQGDLGLNVFLRDQAQMVGHISFYGRLHGCASTCNLGYSIDWEHEGQGLMTEVLMSVVMHAFKNLWFHRIEAAYLPENARSERVLQKLGFETIGLSKQHQFINGAWRDEVITAKINPFWPRTQVARENSTADRRSDSVRS